MLQTRGSGVWNSVEARDFTFTPAVGPGQPPIPRVEWTRRELKHTPPSRGEVKKERSCNCTDLYVFMARKGKILPFLLSLLLSSLSLSLLFITLPFCYGFYWFLSLFTDECASNCLKNNIKVYIKIAPTCFGAEHTIFRELIIRAC